jgi:hypothetical protein
MNSRIVNEFIEQANEWSYKEYDKKETGYTREQLHSQKLAELIIAECCDQVRAIDAMTIRQHFGVEP